MQLARDVPVEIRPWVAGSAIAIHAGLTCLWWFHPWLWSYLTAHAHGLSSTVVACSIDLAVTLVLVALATRVTRLDLGLTRRRLATAAALALGVWAVNQLAQLIDIAAAGQATLRPGDPAGAIVNSCSEELLFRLVICGGATALFRRRSTAIAIAALLFALSHIPHDLATDQLGSIVRLGGLVGFGALMCLVYLASGNLLVPVVLHTLLNEPLLVVGGPDADAITVAVVWLASAGVVIACAQRNPRPRFSPGSPS